MHSLISYDHDKTILLITSSVLTASLASFILGVVMILVIAGSQIDMKLWKL